MSRLICSFLVAVVAVAVLFVAAGCNSGGCNANGSPVISVRNPFQIDREAATSAGERLRYIPQPAVLAAPSWQAIQAPNACAPAYTAPNPCAGGGGTGVPESIPDVRR